MIRKARFRGSWYPYEKNEIEKITGKSDSFGQMRMAVLPHAGLIFSGCLLRQFFSSIRKDIEKVIIISPSHYYRVPANRIIVSDFNEAETPFGTVKVEKPAIQNSITNNDIIAAEHGLEMFLPFIGSRSLSVSFCVINSLNKAEDAKKLADLFKPLINQTTALIASSDFTHYGKRFGYEPYKTDALAKTIESDRNCAMLLASGKGSEAYERYIHSTICGIAAASIVSETAYTLGLSGSLGNSSTSYDLTGDDEDFVSYQSVLWR